MSYIKGVCKCNTCDSELKYAWLYPDAKMGWVPQDCILVEHESTVDGFDVFAKCGSCRKITVIKYNKQGEPLWT